jgi:hypothetical protein
MSSLAVFKILPTTQKYDWGKLGLTSKIAQLISQPQYAEFEPKIDEKSPYAEVYYICCRTFSERPDDTLTSYGWGLTPNRLHVYYLIPIKFFQNTSPVIQNSSESPSSINSMPGTATFPFS